MTAKMARLIHIAAVALLLAGCTAPAGVAPAAPTPTPVVIIATPSPAPTPEPTAVDVYAGDVIFGTKVTNDLKITVPKTTFDRKAKDIAWAAHFTEPAGAPTLTWMVLKKTGCSEQIQFTEKVKVSPDWTITSSHSALPKFLHNKPGKYIMRYVRGSTVLAEGTFTLK